VQRGAGVAQRLRESLERGIDVAGVGVFGQDAVQRRGGVGQHGGAAKAAGCAQAVQGRAQGLVIVAVLVEFVLDAWQFLFGKQPAQVFDHRRRATGAQGIVVVQRVWPAAMAVQRGPQGFQRQRLGQHLSESGPKQLRARGIGLGGGGDGRNACADGGVGAQGREDGVAIQSGQVLVEHQQLPVAVARQREGAWTIGAGCRLTAAGADGRAQKGLADRVVLGQ
jgi:hypothetical protein